MLTRTARHYYSAFTLITLTVALLFIPVLSYFFISVIPFRASAELPYLYFRVQ